MTGNDLQEFVQGDDVRSLRVPVEHDGVAVDVSGGEVRLYAVGQDNGDRPRTTPGEPWTGVLGTFVTDGADGLVAFQGIGALCTLSAGRLNQVYAYRMEYTDSSGGVVRSIPEGKFIVTLFPQPA